MNTTEIKACTYFTDTMFIMAFDNNMPIKPYEEWPKFIDYKYINSQLKRLIDKERETFIIGEVDEAALIIKKYNIQDLDFLFNSIFDGELSPLFFK